ncbi:MAG: hypothetical protein AAB590_01800 [Patescibacteria group bacterium]
MYNVAFVYTRETGGFEGVVTWCTFKSKEDFDKFYTDEIRKRERVVEEGISQERCIELVKLTPHACRVAAAIQKATGPDGEIDVESLKMELHMALMASSLE